jgi:pyruvate/2-oxoglutarate dehydrogenase complex dihydrolipoamide acyltransferase (E2) component
VSELPVLAPFAGTVVAIARDPDDQVGTGEALVVLEAMKMEHEILAEVDGVVRALNVAVGDTVEEGQQLAILDHTQTTPVPREPPGRPSATDDSNPAATSRRYARATT